MLAQGIAERSGRERISEVFLSPDAFAHRTSEASIAEQLGEVFTACGLPRPAPADDDRIGGWQLMYQLLESDSWLITDNCAKLIDCIPQLVRHDGRVEDIRKVDGDDPRTLRVTVWSPVEDSPVLGQRPRALAQTRRSGRGNPRPLIHQARHASSPACRSANRFRGKSAPRTRHHARFIRSASNPKRASSSGPSRCPAAAEP